VAAEAGVPSTAGYPVGRECRAPEAIAREKRTLPPLDRWQTLVSAKQRLRVRVPEGVFKANDGADGFALVSSEKAHGLGPGATDRHFELRFRRLARSVDELLADRTKSSPLGMVYLDDAFPKRTTASFVAAPSEPMGSGSSTRATLMGRPAWVWISGVEGYNSDHVLIQLGPKETLLVIANWNSSIMMGQPECWQRAVIGGVVESLVAES
jgi:hypothetical protein